MSSGRVAYGVASAVRGAQALVPDESVEAVVVVRHRYGLPALGVVGVAWAAAPLVTWWSGLTKIALLAILFALAIVLIVGVQDRASGLRLGVNGGYVAVTATRVLVLTGHWYTLGPRQVVVSVDRADVAARPQRTESRFATLAIPSTDGRRATVRAPASLSRGQGVATALVVAEPGSRWSTDPSDPTTARLWTPSGWSDDTETALVLASAQVDLSTLT